MKLTCSLLHLAVPAALLSGGCDTELHTQPGVLAVHNLGDAGQGLEYHAWVHTDGEYHWFLSFTGGDDAEFEVNVPVPDEDQAASVVISVDAVGADEEGPRAPLLSGRLDTFVSASTNHLHLGGGLGLGTDFVLASAAFVLDTPTTAESDDHGLGVWWHDPAGSEPALNLPELPAGWTYEGWVETSAGRVSTGRFTHEARDSDGAGPTAGELMGWDAPGQDFIDPPLSLPGATIAITVEPSLSDDAAPFYLEPFVAKGIPEVPPTEMVGMFKTDSLRHPSATLELME